MNANAYKSGESLQTSSERQEPQRMSQPTLPISTANKVVPVETPVAYLGHSQSYSKRVGSIFDK